MRYSNHQEMVQRGSKEGRTSRSGVAGALALVERFDTEFNPDFSAKSPNFRRLVLFCIEADFCTQIRILQHFSRTTRFAILCTDSISNFQQIFVKLFRIFAQNSTKNHYFSTFFIYFCTDFDQNFAEFSPNIPKNDEQSQKC